MQPFRSCDHLPLLRDADYSRAHESNSSASTVASSHGFGELDPRQLDPRQCDPILSANLSYRTLELGAQLFGSSSVDDGLQLANHPEQPPGRDIAMLTTDA